MATRMRTAPDAVTSDRAAAPISARPLSADDLPEVMRIDEQQSGGGRARFHERVAAGFLAHGDDRHRIALGVDAGPGLAGFLLGEVRAFEFGSDPCGWIFAVGVDRCRARAGVGSALVRAAGERFRQLGVHQVRTMVKRNDVPVLTFFRANRFVGGSFVQLEVDLDDALGMPAEEPTS